MQKTQPQNIVKETLQNDFNKERFLYFIKNLLNKIDDSKAFHARGYVPEAYKSHVKTYERLATYTDPIGSKVDILVVYLQKETSLERARTAQRNFVARYLKDRNQKDAGLIAFVSPNPADWRFSLVKMEYKFIDGKSGKIKVKEEFTPAKRWSFLVGKNENSHTAQSRLVPIMEDDQINPTLKQLEDAFNIEKVTKEFFEKYRELFLRVYETLNDVIKHHPNIKADFVDKNVSTVDFSKKLLGQIVFLYFLQKKGWFGVKKGAIWGTGSKQFLRDLFDVKIITYKNFFNDILEPLFYDALARDRSDIDHWNDHFQSKIPFLNGGLFDPISNYDWVNTVIDLPNDIFSNTRKTKDGDTGDGILDIFDRYNFTVKEDEPLEKEVAIDPEMLGKVFENLLEVKDRKSKGTYYTPREIVHYMCEQSLVNYLATEFDGKVLKEDLEKLIKIGENVVEHETISITKEDNPKYGGDYKRLLPDAIKTFANEIDDKLATIKVCDPAIGSGAFPVGMMNAIVKARMVLSSYFKDKSRTLYNFKRDCIQNSLYGVDIDPGAVEIAKLRLWLSLVVDEDDIKQIRPLPNLDYKIMQGNSLLEEFEGIKLFNERLLQSAVPVNDTQIETLVNREKEIQRLLISFYQKNPAWMKNRKMDRPIELDRLEQELSRAQLSLKAEKESHLKIKDSNQVTLFPNNKKTLKIREMLESLHKVFFEATQKSKKDNIKKQIEQLEWELIEATLKEQNKISALKKLEEFKRSNTKPFFLWKLNFAEVFEEKGGFDVVIGNPPYGFRNVLTPEEKIYFRKVENIEFSSGDSAELFCKKSFNNLVREDGILTFIIPKKSLYGDAWEGFRKDYWIKYNLKFLLDSSKAFQDVLLEANAFGLAKNNNNESIKCAYLNKDDAVFEFASGSKDDVFLENATAQIYKLLIPQTLWKKIQSNKAVGIFVVGELGLAIGKEFFSEKSTDYKLLKGIDIARWRIKQHRYLKNIQKLKESEVKKFLRPKIISQVLIAHIENPTPHLKITACYDNEGIIITNTLTAFHLDKLMMDKFWLGYLNSSFVSWYAFNFIYSRAIRTMHFYNFYIQQIPIPNSVIEKPEQQKTLAELTERILAITKTEDYLKNPTKQAKVLDIENQIDELVYKLYGLTPKEIKIVENFIKK